MMRLMALLAITSLVLGKFHAPQGKHSEGEIDWEAFPNHVDHDFTYHREFLHALEKSWKGFTTVGIHHAHADINNGAFSR